MKELFTTLSVNDIENNNTLLSVVTPSKVEVAGSYKRANLQSPKSLISADPERIDQEQQKNCDNFRPKSSTHSDIFQRPRTTSESKSNSDQNKKNALLLFLIVKQHYPTDTKNDFDKTWGQCYTVFY